jgi:hypothetical protein
LEFAAIEYGRKGKVVASDEVKAKDQQHWNQPMRSRKRIRSPEFHENACSAFACEAEFIERV